MKSDFEGEPPFHLLMTQPIEVHGDNLVVHFTLLRKYSWARTR